MNFALEERSKYLKACLNYVHYTISFYYKMIISLINKLLKCVNVLLGMMNNCLKLALGKYQYIGDFHYSRKWGQGCYFVWEGAIMKSQQHVMWMAPAPGPEPRQVTSPQKVQEEGTIISPNRTPIPISIHIANTHRTTTF